LLCFKLRELLFSSTEASIPHFCALRASRDKESWALALSLMNWAWGMPWGCHVVCGSVCLLITICFCIWTIIQ
jgi:hypothetical protein